MSAPRRERGAAVIAAMLVAALAASVAAVMLEEQDYAVRRLESARDHEQARWVLRGGTQWARSILAEDARSGSIDHAGEIWSMGLPPTEIEQGTVAGEIRDAQAQLNLRNLSRDGNASSADIAMLRRLLALLALRPELAEQIAARTLIEVGDLHRVPGCDEAVVARLRPFVTVLPQRTAVNVNTAPPEVLVAITEGLDLTQARVIAQARRSAPFRSADEFRTRLPPGVIRPADEAISVQTRYFAVEGRATVGKATARMETLLERGAAGLPAIVWQRIS